MERWVIPVRMMPANIDINAPKPDVYRYLTSFATNGRGPGPQVLAREPSGALLVEFHTSIVGLLGRKKIHRTVERVTVQEPDEIRFEGVEGPLDLLQDRFSLASEEGGTRMSYESTVGLRGSLVGWLICVLYVKPVLGRFMRQHLQRVKESIERST